MLCNKRSDAKAFIKGSEDYPHIRGEVMFYQTKDGVLVSARISGLPQSEAGFFGFHIHEGENCKGDSFKNTGGHYNPKDRPHPSHAGDLPPLFSNRGYAFAVLDYCANQKIAAMKY